MNGQLALLAALAAYGGRWLREGGEEPVPGLANGNSSFRYVGSFTAEMASRGLLRRASTTSSPEEWLAALRSSGVTDLTLITDLPNSGSLPPHVASAFSNAGTWALLATGRSSRPLWVFGWEVGDQNAPDSRIWSVTASRRAGDGVHAAQVDVAQAAARLREALDEIRDFATGTEELEGWASWFAKAATLLDDPAPVPPYHQDLLPPDAPLGRRQLAASVVQGWVFGGMGSWNDVGFTDAAAQREYQRTGANLYSALLAALPAAVNGA